MTIADKLTVFYCQFRQIFPLYNFIQLRFSRKQFLFSLNLKFCISQTI